MAFDECRAPGQVFSDGLADGELRYQRCGSCGAAVFFPRVACTECQGTHLNWSLSSGKGVIYSATVVRRRNEAYGVALVDLDEGYRMMTATRTTDMELLSPFTRVAVVVEDGRCIAEVDA